MSDEYVCDNCGRVLADEDAIENDDGLFCDPACADAYNLGAK